MSPHATQTSFHHAPNKWHGAHQQQSWNMRQYPQQFMMPPHQRPPQGPISQSHHGFHSRGNYNNQMSHEMTRVQIEFPTIYQLIQEQQSVIEQQRADQDGVMREIATLKKLVHTLQEEKKKEDDNIPPVILVGKDEGSAYTAASSSIKKRPSSDAQDNDQNADVDNSTYDSLPLKKRTKRKKAAPNLATVIATLKAATSPSFSNPNNHQFSF